MSRLAAALCPMLAAFALAAAPAAADTFVVDSADDEPDAVLDDVCDSDPDEEVIECTLRAAVQEANATTAHDVIELEPLDAGGFDLSLAGTGEDAAASGDLDLLEPVTILGQGQPVIDALGGDRVLDVDASSTDTVKVSGVELREGGGVETGAGVRVQGGRLELDTASVAGSRAHSPAAEAMGGAVWLGSAGPHKITASTLSGNTADGSTGAAGGAVALEASATLTLLNTTVSGNTADTESGVAYGGGIASDGALRLDHTTVHENTGSGPAAMGGSLAALDGETTLRASIVSGGIAGAGAQNCFAQSPQAGFTSLGGNVEAPNVAFAAQCSLTGPADRFAGSADLAPLADRGGPTQTHALLTTSVALDAVPSCFPITTDQRGEARPSGAACESGSFERQVLPPIGTGCFGRQATIFGTAKRERIVGTPGDDVILGQAGDDLIKARGGNDVVCGGKGSDRVYGAAGADRLAGEDGKDRLFGQAGKDALFGNAGRDLLNGGPGRDLLSGGGRRDVCRGSRKDKRRSC